jgi:hypothetical protein
MTPEDIYRLKTEIAKTISEKISATFVGQSMADVSTEMIRGHLQNIMKDFLARGYHPVVGLIDWDVTFVGSSVKVVMRVKKGLTNEDHARAVNFLFNQEFY